MLLFFDFSLTVRIRLLIELYSRSAVETILVKMIQTRFYSLISLPAQMTVSPVWEQREPALLTHAMKIRACQCLFYIYTVRQLNKGANV